MFRRFERSGSYCLGNIQTFIQAVWITLELCFPWSCPTHRSPTFNFYWRKIATTRRWKSGPCFCQINWDSIFKIVHGTKKRTPANQFKSSQLSSCFEILINSKKYLRLWSLSLNGHIFSNTLVISLRPRVFHFKVIIVGHYSSLNWPV